MIKQNLVTKTQALVLKELGYKELTAYYHYDFHPSDWKSSISCREVKTNNNCSFGYSVPTVDEAIDWLRRKHNVVIYNKIEPFVDPADDTHKKVLFKYGVKRCDVNHLGWDSHTDLGTTRLSTNVYSLKREAISIAIKYIKSQKK